MVATPAWKGEARRPGRPRRQEDRQDPVSVNAVVARGS
jgi:hypothetical protein